VATDLIEIDAEHPDETAIERAAAVVRRGGLVAIPTDALYTIVADPLNLHAVRRVREAKGRAEEMVKEIPRRFYLLARHFWPGPLAIIAPASSRVPLKVTGNTGRLGMRQSRSKVANALLERLNQPLISTSANRSGLPTCASGIDVFGSMDGRVDLVLDCGTVTGLGATTVDITEPYWRVIKEGAIPEKDIAEVLKGT
jgi:L-threonylcarbamoyladenylate synthase